jgi:putative FmdB family regulatory protein
MPLYEYECQKCGAVFEEIRKFSDPPLTHHEGCGGEVRKLLSAPAIQFKGTGWYVTDYARSGKAESDNQKNDKKAAKAEAKGESKSESKGESKGDSKSESSSSESKSSSSETTKTTTTETSKK